MTDELDKDPELDIPTPSPLSQVEDLLCRLEPGSLLTGVVVIAEWLDEDGDPALGIINSQMTPWHMSSMLEYVKEHYVSCLPASIAQYVDADELDDDIFDDDE
jgi:hypothetical protein